MRVHAGALAVILAMGTSGAVTLMAQDDHHDRDQANAMERRDESAYYNNAYYKQGWNDGLHHKKRNHHWKNEADRNAYEAGYAHGERGEKWQNPNEHHDHDNH
jgi:hypothetical protein